MAWDFDEITVSDQAPDPLSYAVAERDRHVVASVERALDTGNVVLAYQPVVVAGGGAKPVFFEGLLRVLDPSGRVIPARDFINEVEATETGRRLDVLALQLGSKALIQRPELRLSINMSARSVAYPLWMKTLEDGLAADPLIAERLILEITESTAITMPKLVSRFVDGLQMRGICVAIDDFGSGYTSMRYLKDFCCDMMKIDGEFCRGVASQPDNRALVSAMVAIARHFDMVTVAECVETPEDARVLTEIGVDCLQGYLFGAPTIKPSFVPCAAPRAG